MKKVLIVEDDRWLASSYRLVLEKHAWQVATSQAARESMELIDEFKPDAVLLDFLLPLANAPSLLNELQSHPDTATLPIILCSSLSLAWLDKPVLKHYGIRAVVDKATLTPEKLVKTLEEQCTYAAA